MTQPMNRQTRRFYQKQGMVDDEGAPVRQQREPRRPGSGRERVGPVTFIRQVISEMKKVVWPTRPELINYLVVTLCALIFVMALIWVFDNVFLNGAKFLFK